MDVGNGDYDPTSDNYVEPEFRYSHYYENSKGGYYYDSSTSTYKVLTDDNYAGTRYSYDSSYCYANEKGEYKRVNGGVYLDLSYFNLPSLEINSKSMRATLANLPSLLSGFGISLGGDDEEDGGEAQVEQQQPDSQEAGEEEDGGLLAGLGDINLPLLSDEIAEYITTFVFGMRMTSSYVALMLNANYINSLLRLIGGEDFGLQFNPDKMQNMPEVKIYSDNHRYTYLNGGDLLDAITAGTMTSGEVETIFNYSRY